MGRGEGPACPPLQPPYRPNPGPRSSCPYRCKKILAGLAGPGGGPECQPEEAPSPSEWIRDYTDSVLDPEALRVEVDTFMEAYDKKTAEVGLLGAAAVGKVGPQVSWWLSRGCGVAAVLVTT